MWLSLLTKKRPEDQQDKTNLAIYGCLVGTSFILGIIRSYVLVLVPLRCSERLHNKMVGAILQAPVLFFDSNPVGRILNRFSKDIGCMDEVLPKTFLISFQLISLLFAATLLPVVANVWLLFVFVPVELLAVYITRYYLKTARELKRLESICRSPVFSHISETLDGLDTIRTRAMQIDFVQQFYRYNGDCLICCYFSNVFVLQQIFRIEVVYFLRVLTFEWFYLRNKKWLAYLYNLICKHERDRVWENLKVYASCFRLPPNVTCLHNLI